MFHSNNAIRDSFMLVLAVLLILFIILFCLLSALPALAQSDSQIITYNVGGKDLRVNNVITYQPGDPAMIALAGDLCTIRVDYLEFVQGNAALVVFRSCNDLSLDRLAAFDAATLQVIDF